MHKKHVRSALTKDQKIAIVTVEGATAVVTSLNREISQKGLEIEAQKLTIQNTQDQLESWREKYHKADKMQGILDSRMNFSILTEIIKFLISSVGVAYGVNALGTPDSQTNGLFVIIVSVAIYAAIAVWQRQGSRNVDDGNMSDSK